ncbi:uncharacterized protein LOC144145527 [Haemaphysalis longicornis]
MFTPAVDDEGTEAGSRGGRAAVDAAVGYREWLLHVGGISVECTTRDFTPNPAPANDKGSPSRSPAPAPRPARAQFPSRGHRSPPSSSGRVVPAVRCRRGCTLPNPPEPNDRRRPNASDAAQWALVSRLATEPPLVYYYLWQQACSNRPGFTQCSVGQWMQYWEKALAAWFGYGDSAAEVVHHGTDQ